MRTSIFEVQTHAARRDGQKASRANYNHSCFDFCHDSDFHSQVNLTKSIFQHDVMHKSCDQMGNAGAGSRHGTAGTLIALYFQRATFLISALKMHNFTSQIY